MKRDMGFVLSWWLVTRLLLWGVGWTGQNLLLANYRTYRGEQYAHTNPWLRVWGIWDSNWYLDIAKYGYRKSATSEFMPRVESGKANYAFFPLYPIAMNIISRVTKDNFVAGLLISNFALIGSGVILYKLMRNERSEEAAKWGVRLLFLYPINFILSGVFSESLFLVLLLGSWYLAKKEKWWWAGLLGFLMCATRSIGIAVLPAFLALYLNQRGYKLRKIKGDILSLAGFPMANIMFMIYLNGKIGDFMAYFRILRESWGYKLVNPVILMEKMVKMGNPDLLIIVGIIVVITTVMMISCLWLKKEDWLLGVGLILPTFVWGQGGLISFPRYSTVIFPLIILWAVGMTKLGKWAKYSVAGTSLVIEMIFMAFWVNGLLII